MVQAIKRYGELEISKTVREDHSWTLFIMELLMNSPVAKKHLPITCQDIKYPRSNYQELDGERSKRMAIKDNQGKKAYRIEKRPDVIKELN